MQDTTTTAPRSDGFDEDTHLAAEAVIKEARGRQRRRRMQITGVSGLLVVGALLGFVVADQGSSPPSRPTQSSGPLSVPRFIELGEGGTNGRFAASYDVAGAHSGAIEVVQKQAPLALNPGSGTWSFVYRADQGFSSQWIQKGASSYDCWQATSDTTWSCTGPGTYRQVNGFILATTPFIPMGVAGQLSLLHEALRHKGWVKSLSVFMSHSKEFGALNCLKVMALSLGAPATICIDHSGTMVREKNWPGGYFSNVTLVRYATKLPSDAFTPLSVLRSGFVLTP